MGFRIIGAYWKSHTLVLRIGRTAYSFSTTSGTRTYAHSFNYVTEEIKGFTACLAASRPYQELSRDVATTAAARGTRGIF